MLLDTINLRCSVHLKSFFIRLTLVPEEQRNQLFPLHQRQSCGELASVQGCVSPSVRVTAWIMIRCMFSYFEQHTGDCVCFFFLLLLLYINANSLVPQNLVGDIFRSCSYYWSIVIVWDVMEILILLYQFLIYSPVWRPIDWETMLAW